MYVAHGILNYTTSTMFLLCIDKVQLPTNEAVLSIRNYTCLYNYENYTFLYSCAHATHPMINNFDNLKFQTDCTFKLLAAFYEYGIFKHTILSDLSFFLKMIPQQLQHTNLHVKCPFFDLIWLIYFRFLYYHFYL